MSTLKADTVTTKSDNTDLTITGGGSGVPDLEAGFKVGSVAGVPTASIRDDAVTLAKLAAGTDGELITWDASGDPAAVAVGTATHVLTSNGAGAAPTFQAAAAGGSWTLIGTQVASASASLTQTGLDSTYDTYAIALSDIEPATDNAIGWIRVGDSSGVDSGGSDYSQALITNSASDGVSEVLNSNASVAQISLGKSGVGTTATGEGMGALLFLTCPGDGTVFPLITGNSLFMSNDTILKCATIYGSRDAVITLDRIQFLFASGNIASGRMTVWGIAHA